MFENQMLGYYFRPCPNFLERVLYNNTLSQPGGHVSMLKHRFEE